LLALGAKRESAFQIIPANLDQEASTLVPHFACGASCGARYSDRTHYFRYSPCGLMLADSASGQL